MRRICCSSITWLNASKHLYEGSRHRHRWSQGWCIRCIMLSWLTRIPYRGFSCSYVPGQSFFGHDGHFHHSSQYRIQDIQRSPWHLWEWKFCAGFESRSDPDVDAYPVSDLDSESNLDAFCCCSVYSVNSHLIICSSSHVGISPSDIHIFLQLNRHVETDRQAGYIVQCLYTFCLSIWTMTEGIVIISAKAEFLVCLLCSFRRTQPSISPVRVLLSCIVVSGWIYCLKPHSRWWQLWIYFSMVLEVEWYMHCSVVVSILTCYGLAYIVVSKSYLYSFHQCSVYTFYRF